MKLEINPIATSNSSLNGNHQEKNLSDNSSEEIIQMLRLGIDAAKNGNRPEARTLLLRVTEVDPQNETAWLWLASISEYPEELLVFLQNVLNINPTNERAIEWTKQTKTLLSKTFVQRGITASQEQQKDSAKQCFLQAIVHDSQNELAWLWLASVVESAEEKMAHLQKVLNINPNNEMALSSMKMVKSQLAEVILKKANQAVIVGDRESARELLEDAMKYDRHLEEAWLLKSYLTDSFDEKLNYFNKVLEINPNNEAAQSGLASIQAIMKSAVVEHRLREEIPVKKAEVKELVTDEEIQEAVDLAFRETVSEEDFVVSAPKVVKNNFEAEEKAEETFVSFEKPDETVEIKESVEKVEESVVETNFENYQIAETLTENSEVEEPALNYLETQVESAFTEEKTFEAKNEEEVLTVQTAEEFKVEVENEVVEQSTEEVTEYQVETFYQAVETTVVETIEPKSVEEQLNVEAEGVAESVETAEVVENVVEAEKVEFIEKAEEATVESVTETIVEEVKEPMAEAITEELVNEQPTVEEKEEELVANVQEEVAGQAEVAKKETVKSQLDEIKALYEEPQKVEPQKVEPQKIEKPQPELKSCPYCDAPNDSSVTVCASCHGYFEFFNLETLLSNQRVDKEVLFKAIQRMEIEKLAGDYNEKEFFNLGLAYLNVGNLREGFENMQKSSQLNPDNKVLRSQLNQLAARLHKIQEKALVEEKRVEEIAVAGKTILVVDDSPTVRKLISTKLERHGHKVVSAIDGMDALAKINEVIPDLILLDITMPRLDGYQVCKLIRNNNSTKEIPIVMISGKDGFFDKVRGRMAGSTGYITKPFGPDVLMKTLETYLN